MSRKQRRKLVKSMPKSQTFVDGDKVTIRYDKIVSREDYTYKTEAYRAFIESNRGKVFTVHRINAMKDHSLIEFEEDTSFPKWLWCDVDLCKASDEDKTRVL